MKASIIERLNNQTVMPEGIPRDALECYMNLLQIRIQNQVSMMDTRVALLCRSNPHESDQRRPCRVGHFSMRILEAEGTIQPKIIRTCRSERAFIGGSSRYATLFSLIKAANFASILPRQGKNSSSMGSLGIRPWLTG